MNFDLEGILDSAKEKAVEMATEKFGQGATPIAEEVANKMEQAVADRMGVTLNHEDAGATDDSNS
jgi:hypothetical protein